MKYFDFTAELTAVILSLPNKLSYYNIRIHNYQDKKKKIFRSFCQRHKKIDKNFRKTFLLNFLSKKYK